MTIPPPPPSMLSFFSHPASLYVIFPSTDFKGSTSPEQCPFPMDPATAPNSLTSPCHLRCPIPIYTRAEWIHFVYASLPSSFFSFLFDSRYISIYSVFAVRLTMIYAMANFIRNFSLTTVLQGRAYCNILYLIGMLHFSVNIDCNE